MACRIRTNAMFGRDFADVYKIDLDTGARAEVAKHLTPPVEFSPGGRYAMNFKEGDFWIYDLESGATRNITKDSKIGFTNQENDYPVSQKPSYGVAGWTKDDHSAIVYDSYDLWEIFPDGAKPRRLTDGRRRRCAIVTSARSRYGWGRAWRGALWTRRARRSRHRTDRPYQPVYVSLEGRRTKKTGYATLHDGKTEPRDFLDKGVSG